MSFKFNRGCWVESWEETQLGEKLRKNVKLQEANPQLDGAPRELRTPMLSIEAKIELARFLFAQWGGSLLEEPAISRLLQRLEREMAFSHQTMSLFGIDRACARCDATAPEGSCCSRGLENKYDVIILLLNLLLGVDLNLARSREDSCFFLGLGGCRLRVRSLLCIEYLCPELEEALGHEGVIRMQAATGGELECSFLLCEAVKKRIATA